eukprot:CAMPEP_0118952842 /NCGR_PEP_ID=MMETSP1169-20130426/55554_1 /TAXON_ID=36882 /ORGANISM="Pyramimonas obovata, Strain CCMP722" /LENGTH=42 /DNA_ID= /DNA_START= /DNA_END= /DNA_ORIENTATION=
MGSSDAPHSATCLLASCGPESDTCNGDGNSQGLNQHVVPIKD